MLPASWPTRLQIVVAAPLVSAFLLVVLRVVREAHPFEAHRSRGSR
jgi:hypothetical protein